MPVQLANQTLEKLAALMRRFEHDSNVSRRQIGELLQADIGAFRDAAVEMLRAPDESRGFQYLVSLLVAQGMLVQVLCDPSLGQEQMVAATKAAQRVDPMADVAIARSLADGVLADSSVVNPQDAARLLAVLEQTSDGTRILTSLMRLLRHSNPHLRSKAVKMIGRATRSVKWLQGRLSEPDPRVRANAIESIFGTESPEMRELLTASLRDSDNRVVGNALLALHHLGECSVIPDLLHLAEHELARFRASAAWAMGESADPRFSEALARLMRDGNASVRSRALTSLGLIKTASAKSRQRAVWRVAGNLQDNPQKNVRRLQFIAARDDGGEFPLVRGTQVQILEDGQSVVTYRFAEKPMPEAMSVSFVFPRVAMPATDPWVVGALHCLEWKRGSDLWCVQPYLTEDTENGDRPADDPPRLTPDAEAAEDQLRRPPRKAECGGFWNAVLQGIQLDQGGTRGKRHVIIFNQSESLYPPPETLESAVRNGTRIHVVSTVDSLMLEDFCRRVRGVFQVAGSLTEVPGLIRSAYLSLLSRYEVSYAPLSPECRSIRVRVLTMDGWGEGNIPVPPEPAGV